MIDLDIKWTSKRKVWAWAILVSWVGVFNMEQVT
eukprot:CAMPEP_0183776242 /NCGR_PEP_ID=MMETSP0739-20130205/46381_1 /TAXON_ID=385413 /ORGANISM="Thalassiosira miniscula, Strain CCMP1093" /LENGTH=33 /DNA_ID= /DNA_START= /DNA_END= /DNA_ORIENTATION=